MSKVYIDKKKGYIIIERYQKGFLTTYSVDEGDTFHESVSKAFAHLSAQKENK